MVNDDCGYTVKTILLKLKVVVLIMGAKNKGEKNTKAVNCIEKKNEMKDQQKGAKKNKAKSSGQKAVSSICSDAYQEVIPEFAQ